MKKIRAIIIFIILPIIAGYLIASHQGHKSIPTASLSFSNHALQPTDQITLVENGTIATITQKNVTTMQTHHPQLIETLPLGGSFVGVDKQLNYSSLLEFSPNGTVTKTLQNGNTGNIDTMNWFTDPAMSSDQKKLAFVSDKNKATTDVQDNALFIENFGTGAVTKIVDPDPHSGGIAHPFWNPMNPNLITYDYYQYDDQYNPYSVIQQYDITSQSTTPLTTQKQNAYQGSFSPDGKHFIFLERNNNITTQMYIADVTSNGLTNIQQLASGDFAYPQFSYTPNHIYYLEAKGNTQYDLYTATVANGQLSGIMQISNTQQLLGNSGFVVEKAPQQ
ncbi:MAG TPA: hypothetical protein VLF93_01385 [Candidatus Saccharimonadales bacterium]|nr:hypothetical protein [Candidatus Saccharimonadales bacterium]